MLFQVGIGSLGGTVFFRLDFVPLSELWSSTERSQRYLKLYGLAFDKKIEN